MSVSLDLIWAQWPKHEELQLTVVLFITQNCFKHMLSCTKIKKEEMGYNLRWDMEVL